MTDEKKDAQPMGNVIRIDEAWIKDHPGEIVRGTDAGLKKLMRRRISDPGTGEAWFGLAFNVFIAVAVAFIFMPVDIMRSN